MEIQTVVWKEEDTYVIKEAITGVTTQGKTIEEALDNLKEAMQLYVEEVPETRELLKNIKTIGAMSVEIT